MSNENGFSEEKLKELNDLARADRDEAKRALSFQKKLGRHRPELAVAGATAIALGAALLLGLRSSSNNNNIEPRPANTAPEPNKMGQQNPDILTQEIKVFQKDTLTVARIIVNDMVTNPRATAQSKYDIGIYPPTNNPSGTEIGIALQPKDHTVYTMFSNGNSSVQIGLEIKGSSGAALVKATQSRPVEATDFSTALDNPKNVEVIYASLETSRVSGENIEIVNSARGTMTKMIPTAGVSTEITGINAANIIDASDAELNKAIAELQGSYEDGARGF
jgi:hypothetical protein